MFTVVELGGKCVPVIIYTVTGFLSLKLSAVCHVTEKHHEDLPVVENLLSGPEFAHCGIIAFIPNPV